MFVHMGLNSMQELSLYQTMRKVCIGSPLQQLTVSQKSCLKNLKGLTCHLYGQYSVDDINLARYNIFSIGQFGENTMPCTKDVLTQHTKRAAHQACL